MSGFDLTFFGRAVDTKFVALYKELIELEGTNPKALGSLIEKHQQLMQDTLAQSCLHERMITYLMICSDQEVASIVKEMGEVMGASQELLYSLTKANVTFFKILGHKTYETLSSVDKELEKSKKLLEEVNQEGTYFAGRYQLLKGLVQNENHLFNEAMQSFEIAEGIFKKLDVPYLAASSLALRLQVLSHRNPTQYKALYEAQKEHFKPYPAIDQRMSSRN